VDVRFVAVSVHYYSCVGVIEKEINTKSILIKSVQTRL